MLLYDYYTIIIIIIIIFYFSNNIYLTNCFVRNKRIKNFDFFYINKQDWNYLNQLIKISDLNRDKNQILFLSKKSFDLNHEFD